jgi:phage recombination protein Bet
MAQNSHELVLQDDNLFSDARIELIRNQIGPGAPNDVFGAMIDLARRRNLDPLAKQITLVKFGSTWQMITTIDGYRSLSAQTGTDAGMDPPVYTWPDEPPYLEDGKPNPAVWTEAGKRKPESCTVTVYKLLNGQRYPFSSTVFFDEYDTGQNRWKTAPKQMIAKVAEAMVRRMAWPSVTSGTYVEEEMDQAIETTGRIVNDAPPRQQVSRPSNQRAMPAQASRQPEPRRMGGRATDGKAIHWRNKLTAFAEANGMTETDLDLVADDRFGAPFSALIGDDLEVLHKEISEVKRDGKLGELLSGLRGAPGGVEFDPETGEALPPPGTQSQAVIDLPDDAISVSRARASAATSP